MFIPKILIIEDEIGIASFLTQGLQEENMNPTHCLSGEDALQEICKQKFDVILLDWTLLNISGLEVCKQIRSTSNINSKTPIIFTTAKDTLEDTITGLQAGANDYIKKPYAFSELIARIQVYLRANSKDHLVNSGSISLDLNTLQCFLDNKQINLTLKEFQLLTYLFEHKNRTCTRKEILENVWDIHFEYDSSVIDVFINAIRKKLNLDKNDSRLQTVRGVGYISKNV
ncbi:response regulator transcription factor [Myroides guanonis]|uniref:DNA-binding response regulator, OmpR family, contains REC and winged-helix (WHTH) domain n=1 Tax=Myroides guanonis TaxID=1150112 RepID=A0A1I3NMG2_9FLAO|nr:response regulator transcription factor [Myroides guanonis]SFJ10357.1 DNA-binding response regulator, OmpR family, contains REC and winged-helix (wHTH) domain [Myroides guanonis]